MRSAVVLFLLSVCTFGTMLLQTGCAARSSRAAGGGNASARHDGIASYYADRYHGRPTASGETFDVNALTAAHKSLPFGTIVRVTNLRNGRSVTVRINDRGPFVEGRVIDLSPAAARTIDMIEAGIVPVKLQILRRAGATARAE